MNWVQFNSLGEVVSRTVAVQEDVEPFNISGQLHPAFVAFAAGEALERNPQKTLIDPFLEVLTTLAIPHYPI